MPHQVRRQRAERIRAPRVFDHLDARVQRGIGRDLGRHGVRHVAGQSVPGRLLGNHDRLRRQPLRRRKQVRKDRGGRQLRRRRIVIEPFSIAVEPPRIDARGQRRHLPIDSPRPREPLSRWNPAKRRQPLVQLGQFLANAGFHGGHAVGLPAFGGRQTRPGHAAQPGRVGRLLQVAELHGHAARLAIGRQRRAVARQNLAPRCRQHDLLL